jgi:transcriptional regulator with XRE-family HTH domain
MRRKEVENTNFDSFEAFFEQAEKRPEYWEERAKIEFTEEVIARMKKLGVNKVELARRLDVRPGFVTRLLSGQNNFEIATMVRLARALDANFGSYLKPGDDKAKWVDLEDKAENVILWDPKEFRRIAASQSVELIA